VTDGAIRISAIEKISGFDILSFIREKFMPPNPDPPEEKPPTWFKWISESGPAAGLLKTIYMLIYWGLKYYITVALVPVAVLIGFIYIVWNLLFGLYNYSNSEISISDKIELMERVMYTKLYIGSGEVPRKWTFMNVFKGLCWVLLFFMFEITAFIVFAVGLSKLMKTIKSTELKTFLIIFYSMILGLIGLWSIRKFMKQGTKMNAQYIDRETFLNQPANAGKNIDFGDEPDKRIEIVKNMDINGNGKGNGNPGNICKDNYEIQTENKFFSIFLNSDKMNYPIIEEFMKKNTDSNKPSSLSKWSKSISSKFGKMNAYIGEKAQKMSNYVKEKSDNLKQTVLPESVSTEPPKTMSDVAKNATDTLKNTFMNFGLNPNKK
jgi:hypothetical protein